MILCSIGAAGYCKCVVVQMIIPPHIPKQSRGWVKGSRPFSARVITPKNGVTRYALFIMFDGNIEISLLQFKALKWVFCPLTSSCHTKKYGDNKQHFHPPRKDFYFGWRRGGVTKIRNWRTLSWSERLDKCGEEAWVEFWVDALCWMVKK